MTHCLTEVGTEDDSVQVGVERKALPREGGGEELIHINRDGSYIRILWHNRKYTAYLLIVVCLANNA